MNIIKKSSSIGFITGLLLSLFTGNAAAAINLAQSPLFLADQVGSNVMVMLDNSGSMTIRMYNGINFSAATNYTGIFDDTKNYAYNASIPVNTAAYTTGYNVPVDSGATGAFVESNCVLPADAATCWSGNFLNWLSTRRIDASRAVLIGGKLESRSAFNYGTNLNYKIIGNNEPSDRDYTVSATNSNSHSPIPDSQSVTLSSPAAGGNYNSTYDPYAKIKFSASSTGAPIEDSATNVIGEFGTTTVTESYKTIKFDKTYVDPIVIATAPSFADSDPVAIRIKGVTTTQFRIKLKRWKYDTGSHDQETISYVVIESGEHELVGGLKLKAGKTDTNNEYVDGGCGNSRTANTPVSFASAFPATPIVISASMTENGGDPINTRVWDIDSSGFKLALQEEENQNGHATETVGYIAIEAGTVDDSANFFKLEAGKITGVNESTSAINYTSAFSSAPAFIAAMQTLNGSDTAALRLDSNTQSVGTVHVEEEKSCDSEITHAAEDVGYIAIEDNKPSYNLAVVVQDEPEGVLHDVNNDVRLGISFYRYQLDKNNIYEGVKTQGGTMRFKIPLNPFIKKPLETDTSLLPAVQQGYRELDGYIGTPLAQIIDAIEHYPMIWGTTPIAENLVEVIRYFEQKTPYYTDMATGFKDFDVADATYPERDPFYIPTYSRRLHCINNNVLIVTDGSPFRDANIDPIMLNYDGDTNAGDGEDTDPNAASSTGNDNLDDVAYWAFCDTTGGTSCKTAGKATVKDTNGDLRTNLRDLRPDATNADLPGAQFLKIDTIGFAGNTIRQVLKDTADNAGGSAYAAGDGEALKTALLKAFENVTQNSSASSVAANSTRLDSNTLIYQASLDSGNWSGQLKAFGLQSDGDINAVPTWHTDTLNKIPNDHNSRNIFTYKPPVVASPPVSTVNPSGAGIAFTTLASFNTTQQADLVNQNIINYLRGDATNDGQALGYRARSMVLKDPLTGLDLGTPHRRLLGDIVNSNPWYVGGDNFGYSILPSTEGSSYDAHLTTTRSRTDVIYVGANDGMLHAFDASTGVEKFAYVPATIIPEIAVLADPGYGENIAHRYFVDGSPRAGDVYYDAAWHTVLVGTTGAGGRGVFALDVTDPDNFATTDVLWEFNSLNNDTDMGYTLSEPTVVRMANDQWAAVVGNGYKSDDDKAVLFILDIKTGAVIKKLDTGTGDASTPNGLSSHIPVDLNGDRIVDVIYAGDILGNLWKFDVSNSNTAQWDSAFKSGSTPVPMFTATDASSIPQPITAKPQVGRHPDGGVMVYFGTGKYFETGDNVVGNSPQVQTYYGLRDDLTDSAVISGRSVLQEQTILVESAILGVRVNSDNDVNYTDTSDLVTNPLKKGWYLDMLSPLNGAEGERMVSASVLRGDRIVFTTLIPNSSPCESGGSSWLVELDGPTGGSLDEIAFDINDDGLFTEGDLVQLLDTDNDGDVDADDEKSNVDQKRSDVGIVKTPSVISDGEKEYKYLSGTTGGVQKVTESSGTGLGRQSWRQLR